MGKKDGESGGPDLETGDGHKLTPGLEVKVFDGEHGLAAVTGIANGTQVVVQRVLMPHRDGRTDYCVEVQTSAGEKRFLKPDHLWVDKTPAETLSEMDARSPDLDEF